MCGLTWSAGMLRRAPVEMPCAVRAGRHAAPAPDAPVVVDDHDPVGLLPGGLHRAGQDARRIAALLAGHRHVELIVLRDQRRVVVGVGLHDVDAALFLHAEHLDPVDLGVPRLVVLIHARVHAAPAADAAGKVQPVPVEHALPAADRRWTETGLPNRSEYCFSSRARTAWTSSGLSSLNRFRKKASRAVGEQPARKTEIGGRAAREPSACSAARGPSASPTSDHAPFHPRPIFHPDVMAHSLHRPPRRTGGGIGAIGLNFGECGSWQLTQSR